MRLYRLGKLGSLDALELKEAEAPRPGPGQVTVRIRACSLNHRDLNIIGGGYTSVALKPNAIPLSDGAGEVIAVGSDVSRWKVGDRVAPIFVQRWLGGDLLPEYMPSALGGPSDGVLAEQITISQEGLVRIPAHMSFEEAATLPCAAVTARSVSSSSGVAGMSPTRFGTGSMMTAASSPACCSISRAASSGRLNGRTTTSARTDGAVPREYATLAGSARGPQFSGVDPRLTSA